MAVFSEFSFWFYRTRIPAQVKILTVKLHGLFQFELKIYLCENVRMRLVKTAIDFVEISL